MLNQYHLRKILTVQ